jgi:anti-sigma factor RsiW
MNCKGIEKYLDAYVDDELEPGLMLDVDRHLEACASCQAVVLVKRKMKSGLARLAGVKAPDHLRERISGLSRRRERLRTLASVAALPLAAAAALLLVLGTPFEGGEEANVGKMMDDVVARHIKSLPMEVQGPDPVKTASWFDDKVNFSVKASALGIQDASIKGARISNVREHQAAQVTYLVDGHRVTLMIFNPERALLSGGRRVTVRGKDVLLGTRNGFNVAVLLDGDIAYAFSSDLPQERLLSLISRPRR